MLVAHPDLHLVLQRLDLSALPQVAGGAARSRRHETGPACSRTATVSTCSLPTSASPNVGWTVLVERPLPEAYAPLLASLARTGGLLLVVCVARGLGRGLRLGRRVVGPIEELRRGAARLEAGDLDARLHARDRR